MPKINQDRWNDFQKGFRKATGADEEPDSEDKSSEDSDEGEKKNGRVAQVLIGAKTSVRKMFGM